MTKTVDLNSLPVYAAHEQLRPLIDAFRTKKKIIIIAGAGISKSAGVPTFQDRPDIKRLFTLYSLKNGDGENLLKKMCEMHWNIKKASPTQFHRLIEGLAKEGRLQRLYTQNIDGLETQLPSLHTKTPLPKKRPWPITIQLHGDLSYITCTGNPEHLARFEPELFKSGFPSCTICEKLEMESERRLREIPVMRPRVLLYNDYFADEDAICTVATADLKAKLDAVIIAGTALKVKGTRQIAKKMCATVRERGGFTAWINIDPPPSDFKSFDFIVQGDCDSVAMHVSSWWLRECPNVLSDPQIQLLQDKYKLFITRSAEAALSRALDEMDDNSISKILQTKQKLPSVKQPSTPAFESRQKTHRHSLTTGSASNYIAGVEKAYLPQSKSSTALVSRLSASSVLPELPDCWELELSERLSMVAVVVRRNEKEEEERESSSTITNLTSLGYKATRLTESLWRLRSGEYLDDETLNAYFELLEKSNLPAGQYIQNTFILDMLPDRQWRPFKKAIDSGVYTMYIPINEKNLHWSFAVITSTEKGGTVHWSYYDSIKTKPPQKFEEWIYGNFPNQEIKEITATPNPKQNNGSDCGLFVLLGIRLLSSKGSHISQELCNTVIPTFRKRVLAELLASDLDPSSDQFKEFMLKEGIRNEEISKETGQDHAKSPSGLFVSQPAAADVIVIDSSDELADSEDEFIESKPKSRKIINPEQLAKDFAGEASMVKILREAVVMERAWQNKNNNSKTEDMELANLWAMVSREKRGLRQRHIHYEFSRQFWKEMDALDSPHNRRPTKVAISKVMEKLGISDKTNWKYVLQLARRALVWTDITDIFREKLSHPSVALCAVPNTTYAIETLKLTNRKVYLDAIRSRVDEPHNEILARLEAAGDLFLALMHSDLSPNTLPIESPNEDLPFEEIVKCE